MRMGGQRQALVTLPPGKIPDAHCIQFCVAPGPVRMGAENLLPIGIQSPDSPARSESLCQLHNPGDTKMCVSFGEVSTALYDDFFFVSLSTTSVQVLLILEGSI
jgi:hypothetical protein